MKPNISVVVHYHNEEKTVGSLLYAIRQQSSPRDDLEVVIADGMSMDGTREAIEDYVSQYPEMTIYLIDNPQ